MIRPIILAALSALSSAAAEKWIRVTTPNFELISTESEKKAREKILYFEQVREFFEKVSTAKQDSRVPVRIVVFNSEQQYKPYRPNEVAAAYYQTGLDRDHIIIAGYLPEAERIAIHEYVHLMSRHSGLNLPIWLNEGTAELYSTLRPTGGKVLVGDLIPGHFLELQHSMMPLERLLEVEHSSAEYNRRAHAGTFYAESWALTHMLQLTPTYRPGFNTFYQAILSGTDSKEALEKAYNLPIADIQKDLVHYIRQNTSFRGVVFPVKFEKANVTPSAAPIDAITAKANCLSILVSRGHMEEMQPQLDELEKTAGDRSEVAEVLAYAAWRANDYEKARTMFERAMQNPNRHPKLLTDAAKMQMSSGGKASVAVDLLRTVLTADSGWTEVRLQLVEALLRERQSKDALRELQTIKKVDRSMASRYFRVGGYTYAANGSVKEANDYAASATKYAKEMWEKEAVTQLRNYLVTVEEYQKRSEAAANIPMSGTPLIAFAPLEREDLELERPRLVRRSATGDERIIEVQRGEEVKSLEGVLEKVDCLGTKVRMHIATPAGPLALAIHDPESIVIRSQVDDKGMFELQCGPQKKPIRADYVPADDTAMETQGVLKIIEFVPQA